jgi:hypothetical protein
MGARSIGSEQVDIGASNVTPTSSGMIPMRKTGSGSLRSTAIRKTPIPIPTETASRPPIKLRGKPKSGPRVSPPAERPLYQYPSFRSSGFYGLSQSSRTWRLRSLRSPAQDEFRVPIKARRQKPNSKVNGRRNRIASNEPTARWSSAK